MSMEILTFGASNSKQSINKKFATYTAECIQDAMVTTLDLNDYVMPLYGIDHEKEVGIPNLAYEFKSKITESDAIIISFAEHNGAYSVAFKNIMDWVSRIDKKIWSNKPMLLLATSPGGRGAKRVLDIAANAFPSMGGNIVDTFSLPSFRQNFDPEHGITDPELKASFNQIIKRFSENIAALSVTLNT